MENNMNGLIYRSLMQMPHYVWHDPTYPFVLPAINWEVMSHEQRVQWLTCNIAGLIKFVNEQADALNLLDADIEKLANEFEKFKESGFDDYYAEQVAKWIDEHLQYIFDKTIKQIYFGLTPNDGSVNAGKFVAYVPDSWSDIEFDTGMIYGQFDYGRLILRFNADGSAVIDNTGRYDDRYTDLERRVKHNEDTLYKPMRDGGSV